MEFPKEDKLDWYYEQIECDCIDIVDPHGVNKVAKEHDLKAVIGKFCLICDDDGLLKEDPKVNPIASLLYGVDDHGQALFGKVLVAKNHVTEDGIETVGLSDHDVMLLQVCINTLIDMHNEKIKEVKHG